VRLAQRGRLERMSRGVYRIAHFPADRLAQYREAVLWAQASQGPERVALSHETALLLYGISDVNPARIHLTVPMSARLRREHPEWVVIHRADLTPQEISQHEGMPVTSVERSVLDVLSTTHRADIARRPSRMLFGPDCSMCIREAGFGGSSLVPRFEPSLSTKRSVQRGLFIRKESR